MVSRSFWKTVGLSIRLDKMECKMVRIMYIQAFLLIFFEEFDSIRSFLSIGSTKLLCTNFAIRIAGIKKKKNHRPKKEQRNEKTLERRGACKYKKKKKKRNKGRREVGTCIHGR